MMDAVNGMSGFVALKHHKLSINTTMSKATSYSEIASGKAEGWFVYNCLNTDYVSQKVKIASVMRLVNNIRVELVELIVCGTQVCPCHPQRTQP